jgi:hypothetical protein
VSYVGRRSQGRLTSRPFFNREPDAMNDRLILIETISFTTSPDELLEALTRIIVDRSDRALFFGDY